MAKKTYVGVNNIARNVSKMYVGVNGVARRVKKAYVGVNGVARQCYPNIKIVTWNGGTDEEIKAMVDAHYAGIINLADYWSVGDERNVWFTTIPTNSYTISKTQAAHNAKIVLTEVGGRTLANGKECAFQWDMMPSMANEGWWLNNQAQTQDTIGTWKDSRLAKWLDNNCANYCQNDSGPHIMRDVLFKDAYYVCGDGLGGTGTISFTAPCSQLSPYELTGGSRGTTQVVDGTWLTYFKTTANQQKKVSTNNMAGSFEGMLIRGLYENTNKSYSFMFYRRTSDNFLGLTATWGQANCDVCGVI